MFRILVVDDDLAKVTATRAALEAVGGLRPDDIDVAGDVASARVRLSRVQYDLLVLDVALPARPGEEVRRRAGLDLLKEVGRRGDTYWLPAQVVAVTGFDDVLSELRDAFGEELVQLVKYAPDTGEWRQILQKAVENQVRLIEERVRVGADYGCLACIVCALRDPELLAVLRLPWKWSKHVRAGDASPYWRGEVAIGGAAHTVYAGLSTEMGIAAAAALSAKMSEVFRPRLLCAVGISAGAPTRTKIGTVIAADPTWEHGAGKIIPGSNGSRFEPAPRQIGVAPIVRAQLGELAGDTVGLAEVRASWHDRYPDCSVKVMIGPLVSGAAVIADEGERERILGQHRKLLGIDMEAYGVYTAAEGARDPRPLALALKAVCDFAGQGKDDQFQAFAAHLSAGVLQLFVERHFGPWVSVAT